MIAEEFRQVTFVDTANDIQQLSYLYNEGFGVQDDAKIIIRAANRDGKVDIYMSIKDMRDWLETVSKQLPT